MGGSALGLGGIEPSFDGQNLAVHGVVVVTIQYRLGRFGFVAHPRVDRRIAASRVGKLRSSGSDRRAALGARQHRRVRGRSGLCHRLRAIGRRSRYRPAVELASNEGFDPQGGRGERHCNDGRRSDAAPQA